MLCSRSRVRQLASLDVQKEVVLKVLQLNGNDSGTRSVAVHTRCSATATSPKLRMSSPSLMANQDSGDHNVGHNGPH